MVRCIRSWYPLSCGQPERVHCTQPVPNVPGSNPTSTVMRKRQTLDDLIAANL